MTMLDFMEANFDDAGNCKHPSGSPQNKWAWAMLGLIEARNMLRTGCPDDALLRLEFTLFLNCIDP